MSDAFKESNTKTFRDEITFITGFGIVADQPFQIGSPSSQYSNLTTYNTILPWGGISGYLRSGEGGGTGTTNIGEYNVVYTTGNQNINNLKTFSGVKFTGYCSGINVSGFRIYVQDQLFVTGTALFNKSITVKSYLQTPQVQAIVGGYTIDMEAATLYDSTGPFPSVEWQNRILYDDGAVESIDWQNRKIYFTWYATGLNVLSALKISGQSVITGGSTPTRFYTGKATGTFSNTIGQFTLDWSSGDTFNYTLTGHTKFNFKNDKDGQTIVFAVANTGNGAYSGIWPGNVRWPSNTIPTQTTGSLAYIDIYTFIKMGSGIYANVVPSFIKF